MSTYGAGRKVRHYVAVIALHGIDGEVRPLSIVWDDGKRFDVEVVARPRRQRTITSGYALRHDVLVQGKRRTLWRDDVGWFVEVPP